MASSGNSFSCNKLSYAFKYNITFVCTSAEYKSVMFEKFVNALPNVGESANVCVPGLPPRRGP